MFTGKFLSLSMCETSKPSWFPSNHNRFRRRLTLQPPLVHPTAAIMYPLVTALCLADSIPLPPPPRALFRAVKEQPGNNRVVAPTVPQAQFYVTTVAVQPEHTVPQTLLCLGTLCIRQCPGRAHCASGTALPPHAPVP